MKTAAQPAKSLPPIPEKEYFIRQMDELFKNMPKIPSPPVNIRYLMGA